MIAGDRHPLGVGAGSLAILAALPSAETEVVITHITPELEAGYPGFAPDFLREQVAQTRRAGFALNPGRLTVGCRGGWSAPLVLLVLPLAPAVRPVNDPLRKHSTRSRKGNLKHDGSLHHRLGAFDLWQI
ncbi:MAG: hypothetical protein POG74_05265 [Acidocella sp.]|nr:hypothetical protein [Acidocella sp.]